MSTYFRARQSPFPPPKHDVYSSKTDDGRYTRGKGTKKKKTVPKQGLQQDQPTYVRRHNKRARKLENGTTQTGEATTKGRTISLHTKTKRAYAHIKFEHVPIPLNQKRKQTCALRDLRHVQSKKSVSIGTLTPDVDQPTNQPTRRRDKLLVRTCDEQQIGPKSTVTNTNGKLEVRFGLCLAAKLLGAAPNTKPFVPEATVEGGLGSPQKWAHFLQGGVKNTLYPLNCITFPLTRSSTFSVCFGQSVPRNQSRTYNCTLPPHATPNNPSRPLKRWDTTPPS